MLNVWNQLRLCIIFGKGKGKVFEFRDPRYPAQKSFLRTLNLHVGINT